MQTHLPIGYKLVDGKINMDFEKSDTVEKIYKDYVNGKSMIAIAKELTKNNTLNANNRTNWTHGAIGKILQNTKYIGDELYPQLVSNEMFSKVQEKRTLKAVHLGRTAQLNSIGNHSIFTSMIVCGECGESYRRYIEHCGKPNEKVRWKCKHYIFNNRVLCRNLFCTEDEIKMFITSAINKLLKKKALLDKSYKKEPLKKSIELKKVELKILELEEKEQFFCTELVHLIFKRAELTYKSSKIEDYLFKTQKIKETLNGIDEFIDFNEDLIENIIKKIVIHKDGKIEVEFINGIKHTETRTNK